MKISVEIDAEEVLDVAESYTGRGQKARETRAMTEATELVESVSIQNVHVLSSALLMSIESLVTEEGGDIIGYVGSPVPYAGIEEFRGLDGGFSSADPNAVARQGKHSYLAPAVVDNENMIEAMFFAHMDPEKR